MAEEKNRGQQRRASFRVKYPPNYTPRIQINGVFYTILDVSEKGILFNNPLRHRMPDDIFSATIIFHDNIQVKVVARVIRIERLAIALYFLQGIPFKRIMEEQVYINNLGKSNPT